MIDLYYSPTPNGWKVAIMLEESGLEYQTVLLELPKGDQLSKEFLKINPNGKIPAIVDHSISQKPVTVFESGAILLYLAQKTQQFQGGSECLPKERNEWLFWQASNLGPMAGQLSHFINYASEKSDYSLKRYRGEYERCLSVLDARLYQREFILSEYSIADMMVFPWAFIAKNLGIDLTTFPNVMRWRHQIKQRPAVRNAINLYKESQFTETANAVNAPLLFNQTAQKLTTSQRLAIKDGETS